MDIVGIAINELEARVLSRVAEMYLKTKPEKRSEIATELSKIVADGKREFENTGIKDPRLDQALAELDEVFSKIAQGKNPFVDEEKPFAPGESHAQTVIRMGMDKQELETAILILCTVLRDANAEWSPSPDFRARFPELCDKIDKIYGD